MERSLILHTQGKLWVGGLERGVLFLLLFSVFLFPPITISNGLPAFYGSDLLVLPMSALVLYRYRLSFIYDRYIQLLAAFCLYIIITMAVNQRLGIARDYFEVMKTAKFAIAILFIAAAGKRVNIMNMLRAVFVLLVLFNILQYTGLFHFNDIIETYYSNEKQLSVFGLNSLGQPDTRRLLGTMGNPNPNALVFLFFTVLFMPGKSQGRYDRIFFYISILFVFFCQSRTGFIALILILIIGFWLFSNSMRTLIQHIAVILLLYGLFMVTDRIVSGFNEGTYLGSLLSPELSKTGSVQGRLTVWGRLWEMIKHKPLLGYGPYKEYFYDNNLYPESEYVLMTWRYGFIGLVIYMASLVLPSLQALRVKAMASAKKLILFTVAMLVTAFTNTPFLDPSIMMVFALAIGMLYSDIINLVPDEKTAAHRT